MYSRTESYINIGLLKLKVISTPILKLKVSVLKLEITSIDNTRVLKIKFI